MVDELEVSVFDIIPIIIAIVAFMFVLSFTLVRLDGDCLKTKQLAFQRSLRNACKAYAKQYSFSNTDLRNISEGYLLDEDFDKYAIYSNPLNVDRQRAMTYMYHTLEYGLSYDRRIIDNMDLYMVVVTTKFNPMVYTVEVLSKGISPLGGEYKCNNLHDMQNYVEGLLRIKLDINFDNDPVLRKVQEYERKGRTGSGDKTYSTFTTFMAIGKKIKLPSLFKNNQNAFSEIQTYSTGR